MFRRVIWKDEELMKARFRQTQPQVRSQSLICLSMCSPLEKSQPRFHHRSELLCGDAATGLLCFSPCLMSTSLCCSRSSSLIPVGRHVRALSTVSSPRHSACRQELLCCRASVTLSLAQWRTAHTHTHTHTRASMDTVYCMHAGRAASRAEGMQHVLWCHTHVYMI